MDTSSPVRPPQDQLGGFLLDVLPQQGRWSEEDYLWLTDHSNRLIELTDGYLEVLSMPTERHQILLAVLFELFRAYTRDHGGKVLFAPLRVRIRDGKFREPDLLMVRDQGDARRGDRYWTGADLVLEIVSPDKPERDRIDKRLDYAEAGVPEYWIVDPSLETVTVLKLEGAAYVEASLYGRGSQARSPSLVGLQVDVNGLFDAE